MGGDVWFPAYVKTAFEGPGCLKKEFSLFNLFICLFFYIGFFIASGNGHFCYRSEQIVIIPGGT